MGSVIRPGAGRSHGDKSAAPVRLRGFALLTLLGAFTATAGAQPFTVNDMLRLEGFGSASADPSGKWFVYEQIRPYEEIDDFSFRTYAFGGKSGHQLWRYEIEAGEAPERLRGLDPAPHSYQLGFSPTGRFLTVMQYRFGVLRLLAYDMSADVARTFSELPAFSRDGEHHPVWISDEDIAFSALPPGAMPAASSVRAFAGIKLPAAWEAAWRGRKVTAMEAISHSQPVSWVREDGALIRASARTGRSEHMADGLHAGLTVSPAYNHLAAFAVFRSEVSGGKVEEAEWQYRIRIFDLQSGDVIEPAPDLSFAPTSLVWSADGTRLAAFGWEDSLTAQDGRFRIVDMPSGSVQTRDHSGLDLVSERERGGRQTPERAVFLGDDLAVFARRQSDAGPPAFSPGIYGGAPRGAAGWYTLPETGGARLISEGLTDVSGVPVRAGRDGLVVTAEPGAWLLTASSPPHLITPASAESASLIAAGNFATRSGVFRPPLDEDAILALNTGNGRRLMLAGARTGSSGPVTTELPETAGRVLALAPTGEALFETSTVSGTVLSVTGPAGPRQLAAVNGYFADREFGTWKKIAYQTENAAGEPPLLLESCVLLPPGYRPDTPRAVIVDVYPGAGPSCQSGKGFPSAVSPLSPYIWSGRGYVYTRLTLPRDHLAGPAGPVAGMPDLVEAGLDALIAEGIADPDRAVLTGFSQGGVSALYVAAHSDRFNAVISVNSWADHFSHYFGGLGLYSYVYGRYYGADAVRYTPPSGEFSMPGTPFDHPQSYYQNSPLFLAPQITAPVMLVHSDLDAFSMAQYDAMFGALRASGKYARYIRYLGEGHGPSSPANIRDLWQRIDAFLAGQEAAPGPVTKGREPDQPAGSGPSAGASSQSCNRPGAAGLGCAHPQLQP